MGTAPDTGARDRPFPGLVRVDLGEVPYLRTPDHRKLASIGMRIRGGVTSHGFSLNVDPDMSVFQRFVSCGLSEQMASLRVLAEERGAAAPDPAAVAGALAAALGAR